MTNNAEHLFMHSFFAIICLLRFAQIFSHLKNCVTCFPIIEFENSLYIIDCSLLSDMHLANIFSWSMAFLFIFFSSVFKKEDFNFNDIQITFSFMMHFFCPKKFLSYPRSQIFPSKFSFRNFIVLGFTFRSMIHFVLNFYRYKVLVQVYCFEQDVQLFQYHFLKRSYLIFTFMYLCKKYWRKVFRHFWFFITSKLFSCFDFFFYLCANDNTLLKLKHPLITDQVRHTPRRSICIHRFMMNNWFLTVMSRT